MFFRICGIVLFFFTVFIQAGNIPAYPGIPLNASVLKDSSNIKLNTDSLSLDSLSRLVAADSLIALKSSLESEMRLSPPDQNSTATLSRHTPFVFYSTDGTGLSEGLGTDQHYFPVTFGLSSQLNRSLWMGFPVNMDNRLVDGIALPQTAFTVQGDDIIFLPRIESASFGPAAAWMTQAPSRLISPRMLLYWENGAFNENTLAVHFCRPFSDALSMSLSSNFRHFEGMNYSHDNGDIYNFYQSLYYYAPDQAEFIVNKGYYPQTDEQISTFSLRWEKKGTLLFGSYTYGDMVNELTEQVNNSLSWQSLHQYLNRAQANASFKISNHLALSADGFRDNIALRHKRLGQGEYTNFNGNIAGFLQGSSDTFDIRFNIGYRTLDTYQSSSDTTNNQTISAEYSGLKIFGKATLKTHGSIGFGRCFIDDSINHFIVWNIQEDLLYAGQKLSLFARQSATPYQWPFDTADQVPGPAIDRIQLMGVESDLTWKKLGLGIGYYLASGVANSTVLLSWPDNQPPCDQPAWSIFAQPRISSIGGLTIGCGIIVSDAAPTLKARALLSYIMRLKNDQEHVFFDLGYQYWSERVLLPYAGSRDWNTPVNDVYFKMAVQIKTFRLFWKIDNLLNRRFAYIPGYYSPGLTLRWGFNWLLAE